MRYTKIPNKTFEQLVLNAGILLENFNPADGSFEDEDIIGATDGGVSFNDAITFKDWGEGIDNCPANMKELKRVDTRVITIAGTLKTVTPAVVADLAAAADVDGENAAHIVPRNDLKLSDFKDKWWVGDYSDKNGEAKGGFIAIHLTDALSTGGLQIQSADNDKGSMPFTYTAHYSMSAQDKVPYEIYVKAGEAEGA